MEPLDLKHSFHITDEQQAYFAIVFACLAADDTIHHQEIAYLNHMLFQQGVFVGKSGITLFKQMYELHQAVGGSHGMIQLAAGHISEGNKEKVYTDALLAMVADGAYHEMERRVLYTLQQALALSDQSIDYIQEKVIKLE